jgi:dihydroorotate dehydrogenase
MQRWSRYMRSWVWLALLGGGLILSGTIAWVVGATSIILPYDQTIVGLSRTQLLKINGRLPAFMAHDRIAFAGALISVGILYMQLAIFGVRRGEHWARTAIINSALIGFASFFLWLAFQYFDPVHALATLLLLVPFILGALSPIVSPNQRTDASQPSQIISVTTQRLGQLSKGAFLLISFGITLAGVVIAFVGATQVFVPQDLEFMGTTVAHLRAVNPLLVPLIAHDRAGLGGALISIGVGVFFTTLRGFRYGERWLWWTLVGAGMPGFVAALGVHFAVGYLNFYHLFPGFVALFIYLCGLALAFPYLYAPQRSLHAPRLLVEPMGASQPAPAP